MQALFDAGKQVYSFSKLSTIENCLHEAYLTYMKHERGAPSVYGILGGCVHDKLEEIMNGEADKADLEAALDQDLEQLNLLDLKFPLDFKGGDSIQRNWTADMEHFVQNFEKPEGVFDTEEFLLYKVDDDHYIQGYADLVRYDTEDGSEQSILDWKTSSMYDEEGLKHHGRQLVIYALAKEQAGIKINELAWIFLKYVTVIFMGKKRSNSREKTEIVKNINRRKIISELDKYIRNDLAEAGYDEMSIELYMASVQEQNSLEPLPENIKAGYKIEPCIVKYELTDEVREECKEYIRNTIKLFEEEKQKGNWTPRSFYRETKLGPREDTFFCNALCNHRYTCQHLADFNAKKLADQQELEDFL